MFFNETTILSKSYVIYNKLDTILNLNTDYEEKSITGFLKIIPFLFGEVSW